MKIIYIYILGLYIYIYIYVEMIDCIESYTYILPSILPFSSFVFK